MPRWRKKDDRDKFQADKDSKRDNAKYSRDPRPSNLEPWQEEMNRVREQNQLHSVEEIRRREQDKINEQRLQERARIIAAEAKRQDDIIKRGNEQLMKAIEEQRRRDADHNRRLDEQNRRRDDPHGRNR